MILLSLGTHQQPFPRAVDLIEPLARQATPVIVQHGSTAPRPDIPFTTWVESMPYEDIVATMTRVDSVVCHAGVGTIITALKTGHTPVVIPRLAQHDEHVDDHQLDIATRFAERGLVRCVTAEADLKSLLTPRSDTTGHQIGRGCAALRTAVADAVAAETGRRIPFLPLGRRVQR